MLVSMLVSPPSAQWWQWCAWHSAGGRSQPGKAHPRSRATSARRRDSGAVRIARPTTSGSDAPPKLVV